MKNKKWKRKAKRLLGYCIKTKCPECKYYKIVYSSPFETEFDCCAPSYMPGISRGIRFIEKEFNNSINKQSTRKRGIF